MARSLMSYVSGLIAGSQPAKSDFRSFSKPLPNQFLLQIKLFRGPKLPKQHFKAQKSKIELKMSKNGFRLDASDRENFALRTAPASLQNFKRSQTGRHGAFCLTWELLGPSWGPPTIGQKMARSLMSYVSGLIAGSQPAKSDFRSFSKPLPNQFLLQIKLFRGPKLPKQHFKAQKSKIELKMSKNGFRLDASDRENFALRTAPASLQNFKRSQTGRHGAFCLTWELLGPSWAPPRSARKWLVL